MSLDKLQKIRVNMDMSYISLMFEANKSSTRKRSFKVHSLNPTPPNWTQFHMSFNWGSNVKIISCDFAGKIRRQCAIMYRCSNSYLIFITSGEGYKTLFTFLGHRVPHKLRQGHFSTYFISMYAADWRSGAASGGKPPVNIATASQLSPGPRNTGLTGMG